MHDSRFWRFVAVSLVVALLYLGHGLHSGRRDGLPSLANSAHAGGVGVVMQEGSQIFTASQDGKILYHWVFSEGKAKYFAADEAAPKPIGPPPRIHN
jgi:hypothetical protein